MNGPSWPGCVPPSHSSPGSVALTQLVPALTLPGARQVLGVGAALCAAALSMVAHRRWVDNETAMRHHLPLPYSRLPASVAILLTISALSVAILDALV